MYQLNLISSVGALLGWDLEVNMPSSADKSFRADQSAFISGLYFEKFTSPEIIDLVKSLIQDNSLSEIERKNVILLQEDLEKMTKFSKEFIEREAKLTTQAHNVWADAKTKSDFKLFAPVLEQIIELLREKTDILGYEQHPYNALLNLYEKGSNVSMLDTLFSDVKLRLKPLIEAVLKNQSAPTNFFTQYFAPEAQLAFTKEVLDFLQCNSSNYHLGLATHPFCTHFHPTDIRMTTRINPNDLKSVLWSAIHEMGHGLYEMGLNKENVGMPESESASLGIHESQSRFWENNIGRSFAFIKAIMPILQKHFPEQMKNATPEALFAEANYVAPTHIRTESDELTYHYHIMIRYEIEKKLIEGTLGVKDVVSYWNQSYKNYLNIDVTNDAEGALQDIHWSMGGMGYFPTYSQGSFFAAQWYSQISKTININESILNGNFTPIQKWHNQHIHHLGKLRTSNEICKDATGEVLNFNKFEQYIIQKFGLSQNITNH